MNVAEVFEELEKQRTCIRIEGDRLLVPKGRLPRWLIDGLRLNKEELLQSLNFKFNGKIPQIVDCSPPEPEF